MLSTNIINEIAKIHNIYFIKQYVIPFFHIYKKELRHFINSLINKFLSFLR